MRIFLIAAYSWFVLLSVYSCQSPTAENEESAGIARDTVWDTLTTIRYTLDTIRPIPDTVVQTITEKDTVYNKDTILQIDTFPLIQKDTIFLQDTVEVGTPKAPDTHLDFFVNELLGEPNKIDNYTELLNAGDSVFQIGDTLSTETQLKIRKHCLNSSGVFTRQEWTLFRAYDDWEHYSITLVLSFDGVIIAYFGDAPPTMEGYVLDFELKNMIESLPYIGEYFIARYQEDFFTPGAYLHSDFKEILKDYVKEEDQKYTVYEVYAPNYDSVGDMSEPLILTFKVKNSGEILESSWVYWADTLLD